MMMNTIHPNSIVAIILFVVIIVQGCNNKRTANKATDKKTDSLAIRKSIAETPQLSAEAAIQKMHIEDGFEIKLVASEPMVVAPVAMVFDKQRRIWAVEMLDYMPDTAGTGEEMPLGKIVILTDTNNDGVMDDRKVLLDSLVLPRAICLIEDGILVAEPPKLWYYIIREDKPVYKILVDSTYADGGNVEHQPNGLFRAMDNWIYNAKSDKRYRKEGNKWLVEKTHFRGQWGITQDNYGRLYYNTNSENLLGDYFMPGLGAYNPHQRGVAGYAEKIVEDNRVYPVRPTPGVNRGYMKGVLDDSLRLVNFTAACGPVIYNGGLFEKMYDGNAFVAEPSANLVKRNILHQQGYITDGREAYEQKEFLASEDERFRPVSLYNGPDGALYVVDMYRGIIQHKTYLTPYLKNEIKERSLTKPLNCGRIYKIVPLNNNKASIPIDAQPDKLVQLLAASHGWLRSTAQQLLIDTKAKQVVPALRSLLQDTNHTLPAIHALWTLEGLHALQAADVKPLLQQAYWPLRMEALSVLPSVINAANYKQFIPMLQQMITANDTLAAPYIGYIVHYIQPLDKRAAGQLLTTLTEKYGNNSYVADAVISNLENREESFYKQALNINPDTSLAINKRLKKVLTDIAMAEKTADNDKLVREFPKGAALFQSLCQTCHGKDGNGISALAPPLNNSDWVTGDKNKLIPIVLYGLTGAIKVTGKIYTSPEINGDMPGIGANKEFTDEDIAQVLSFIRSSWNNDAGKITANDIMKVRAVYKDRQKTFTMEELKEK